MNRRICILALLLVAIQVGAAEGQSVLYVDDDASFSTPGGESWDDAFSNLQAALTKARAAGSGVTEIRIAQGTYLPDTGFAGQRARNFKLVPGVTMLGGYAGITSDDPDARDPAAYLTVLSGDLHENDDPSDDQSPEENSYNVVRHNTANTTSTLDGITVSGGYANGSQTSSTSLGACVYILNCTLVARDCVLSDSYANYGGAIYCTDGAISLTDCLVQNNSAHGGCGVYLYDANASSFTGCTFSMNNSGSGAEEGGAIYCRLSTFTAEECEFDGNSNGDGGAVFVRDGDATLTDCTFIGNFSRQYGGAIHLRDESKIEIVDCEFTGNGTEGYGYGGAISVMNQDLELSVQGSSFTGNSADYGGAIYAGQNFESAVFHECSFHENEARFGGALSMDECEITDCEFADNVAYELGGAIKLNGRTNAHSTLDGCTFLANSASRGGGIHTGSSETGTVDVSNCMFVQNAAGLFGGAVYALDGSSDVTLSSSSFLGNFARFKGGAGYFERADVTLMQCLLSSNTADLEEGGAAYIEDSHVQFNYCTLAKNHAYLGTGGGIYQESFASGADSLSFANCILWENADSAGSDFDAQITAEISNVGIAYCDVQDLPSNYQSNGNIDDDPLFVSPRGADDTSGTEDDNYHLQQTSPCINAGRSTDAPDPDGTLPDMGAFPFDSGQAFFVRGDCNGDGAVDIADPIYDLCFLFFGSGTKCLIAHDTNSDGRNSLGDSIYTLKFLYLDGPEPPAPFNSCGQEISPSDLGCLDPPECESP